MKQQSDNTYTVFGRNIPRLLKRIKEEYERGKLAKLTRGPIGIQYSNIINNIVVLTKFLHIPFILQGHI